MTTAVNLQALLKGEHRNRGVLLVQMIDNTCFLLTGDKTAYTHKFTVYFRWLCLYFYYYEFRKENKNKKLINNYKFRKD